MSFLAAAEASSETSRTTTKNPTSGQKRDPAPSQQKAGPSRQSDRPKGPVPQRPAADESLDPNEPQWEVGDDDLEPVDGLFDEFDDAAHDPYNSAPASLPPRSRSGSRGSSGQPRAAGPSSRQSDKSPGVNQQRFGKWPVAAMGLAAGCIAGILVGMVLFSGSDDTGNATDTPMNAATDSGPGSAIPGENQPHEEAISGQSAAPESVSDVKLPEPKPEMTEVQLAEAADIRRTLEKMKQLIQDENDRELLIQYGPLDELRRLQAAETEGRILPAVPRADLLAAINAVESQVAVVNTNALTAQLRAEGQSGGDPKWAPGPGYEGDVSDAIGLAISDIEKGRLREFIINMFPPDALRAMFRNGPEFALASKVNRKSALIVRTLQDLKALKSLTPQITGDVAEFVLPPPEYDAKTIREIRPALDLYPVSDRIIRFSRISGRWRFYDNGSIHHTGALGGSVIQLKMERIGASWRLSAWP